MHIFALFFAPAFAPSINVVVHIRANPEKSPIRDTRPRTKPKRTHTANQKKTHIVVSISKLPTRVYQPMYMPHYAQPTPPTPLRHSTPPPLLPHLPHTSISHCNDTCAHANARNTKNPDDVAIFVCAIAGKMKLTRCPFFHIDEMRAYFCACQRATQRNAHVRINTSTSNVYPTYIANNDAHVLCSQVNHVKIDSAVFRLHTNATVVLLVTFSIAVTTRQYVGNPIDCVHTR